MATNYSNNNISAIKLQNKEYKIKSIPFHGTHDEWLINSSYIPKQGEIIIYDIDSNYNYERIKIGDGVTPVTDLPFYLENEIEKLSINSDWSQNDENASDYIKNRTHWSEKTYEVIVPATTETYVEIDELLSVGPYIVILDGVEYECVAGHAGNDRVSMGHNHIVDNVITPIDPPFFIESFYSTNAGIGGGIGGGDASTTPAINVVYGDSEQHTIEIAKLSGLEYHQLDENYIPNSIARSTTLKTWVMSDFFTTLDTTKLDEKALV